ncbi:2-isopropylmalate synthase [Carboxydochorda subterranea]|uniref:2-isopropylmalate synthase n=1 Tax=Carboxydichorda subterranea TaxID=3109565 RepID=A0ABZ1BUB8_9FIRM|nr:2-isopropylmalate synthase [Limnochorda sp. L945t]WRP16406.1 2-isopropylmalate synthase [Limnochorda sp. L945t]
MVRIQVFDTTLRDGEQSPGASLNELEKLEVARQLDALGVDVIEAGFPAASPGELAAVQEICRQVRRPTIAVLARGNPRDIEAAGEAVKGAARSRIHVFVATSPIHMQYKLRKSPEEVLQIARESVRLAAGLADEVEFSAEDATRSDPDFLCRVFEAVLSAGATIINIPDTVGYATPSEYAELFRYVKAHTSGIERATLSAHCHDDLGLAVANTLAAVEAGARQVEGTINGIGERAGNAALEEVVMALKTRQDRFPFETGIVTEQLYRTSRLVSQLTGIVVQPNKAIVGDNAFAHEAGIHQDGMLKERRTYEIMRPEWVGQAQSRLVLGKHSGRHAVRHRLEELGYQVSDADLAVIYERLMQLADRKKSVTDRDLVALVEEHRTVSVPERYLLEYFHVASGTGSVPTATVRLRLADTGELVQEAACGDGPVDALYRAIERAGAIRAELVSYQLQAVTSGKDAMGEVTVRVRDDGQVFVGRAASTDVLEASARAYLQAVNRMTYAHQAGAEAPAAAHFQASEPAPAPASGG